MAGQGTVGLEMAEQASALGAALDAVPWCAAAGAA
jgi:threonine dehydratase